MFFKVLLYQNVFIPARFFGENLNNQILSTVITMTEGKKISPFGTVVIVIAFFPTISLGKILPGSSSALFRISYDAITFRAMKGEVIDVLITHVTKFGFFGEAGLLEVFVSKKLMPSGFVFDPLGNQFVNQTIDSRITKDTKRTIRIIGIRNQSGTLGKTSAGTIQAIGTMNI